MDLPRPVLCVECGQRSAVPIAYGLPGPEMMDLAERGLIELGGCCADPGLSNLRCRSCGHSWVDD